jgi:Tol biopolymer transport system component
MAMALCLATLPLFACGDDEVTNPPPGSTGTLAVSTTSIGSAVDADGYTVRLDGNDAGAVGTNDSVTVGVAVGEYDVELTGLADNCGVIGENPISATAVQDEATPVQFSVACPPFYDYIALYVHPEEEEARGIYVMESDGSNPVNVTKHIAPGLGCYLDWSPDGTRLMGRRWYEGAYEIQVMLVDGSQPVTIVRVGLILDAEWSPDGSRIAFVGGDLRSDIWVVNPDGSDLLNLSNSVGEEWSVTWSPDASRLACTGSDGPSYGLYVMDADGSNVTLLRTATDTGMTDIVWSPDGNRIGYSGLCETDPIWREICTVDADGSDPVNLTNHRTDDWQPDWSPDGSRIVFMSRRGDADATIYEMQSDGSNVVQVAEEAVCPAWSPGQ